MMEGMYAAFAVHAKASNNSARLKLARFYSPAREAESFQFERFHVAKGDDEKLALTGTVRLNALLDVPDMVECTVGEKTWTAEVKDRGTIEPDAEAAAKIYMVENIGGTLVYRVVIEVRKSSLLTRSGELVVKLREGNRIFTGKAIQTP